LVLDTYGPGTLLGVLEPTGDHPGYPVLNEGQTWVRVRAVDGLVGWVMGSQVEVE
jgi:SH3-like domain-containing protein